MKSAVLRFLAGAAALAALSALFTLSPPGAKHEAKAAVTVMCAPNPLDQSSQRTLGQSIGGGTQSQIPSGTLYTLNGQGCTTVKQADLGWFLSQGFTAGPPFGPNIIYTTGVSSGTTDFTIGTLPPSTYIQHVIVSNATANAVTGGISFGTTANGTDIVSALTCGANCLAFTADSALSKRVFSTSAATAIHAAAVTAWNSANVTITVVYGYF